MEERGRERERRGSGDRSLMITEDSTESLIHGWIWSGRGKKENGQGKSENTHDHHGERIGPNKPSWEGEFIERDRIEAIHSCASVPLCCHF